MPQIAIAPEAVAWHQQWLAERMLILTAPQLKERTRELKAQQATLETVTKILNRVLKKRDLEPEIRTQAEKGIAANTSQIASIVGKIADAKALYASTKAGSARKSAEEMRHIFADPRVRGAVIRGNQLVLRTVPLRSGSHPVGRFEFTILSQKNWRDTRLMNLDCTFDMYQHPHIGSSGNPCLGEWESGLNNISMAGDLYRFVDGLFLYINGATSGSTFTNRDSWYASMFIHVKANKELDEFYTTHPYEPQQA